MWVSEVNFENAIMPVCGGRVAVAASVAEAAGVTVGAGCGSGPGGARAACSQRQQDGAGKKGENKMDGLHFATSHITEQSINILKAARETLAASSSNIEAILGYIIIRN